MKSFKCQMHCQTHLLVICFPMNFQRPLTFDTVRDYTGVFMVSASITPECAGLSHSCYIGSSMCIQLP